MENKLIQMKDIIEKSINITLYSTSLSKKKRVVRDQIFPNEILFKIFSYCDIDTLFHSIPYVSHQWNSLLTKISFAGQINLKIYDDEQFKKMYKKSKSSRFTNPYALPNSSYGYTGYSSYGSYGGLSNYDSYTSYSNYTSYGNYDGYGSFNGYGNYNNYSGDGYGGSSSSYSLSSTRKDKESIETSSLLEPNYQIKLLDSVKTNNEVSMPVVFKIDLSLPLSYIQAEPKKESDDSYGVFEDYDDYFSNELNDLDMASSSNSNINDKKNKNDEKNTCIDFNLEPIQEYLVEKQKEIKQFKAFYYIHGIEISIDTDKVITEPTNQNVNTNENQATSSSEEVSSVQNSVVSSSSVETETSSLVNTNNAIQNESESLLVTAQSENITNTIDNENSSSLSSSVVQDNTVATDTPTTSDNPVQPPNSTMILTELLLEKYRFTPEILKIQNVQWSDKFVHTIPKSVKMIDIKYLGNPDPELLKEGTDYLYRFIKNLSISASSILRPRTRRTNRFYRSSVNRTSITVN